MNKISQTKISVFTTLTLILFLQPKTHCPVWQPINIKMKTIHRQKTDMSSPQVYNTYGCMDKEDFTLEDAHKHLVMNVWKQARYCILIILVIDARYHDFNGFPVVNWY